MRAADNGRDTSAINVLLSERNLERSVNSKEVQYALLKKHFEKDILGFAKFCFPHQVTKDVPQFHKELYALYLDFSRKKIAVAAPRG